MRLRSFEQLDRPADGLRAELVERPRDRDRLSELRQLLELAHATPHVVVEPRVLDRPGDERRDRDKELRFRVGELARRLRVQRDRRDRVPRLVVHRHGDERLESLLFELRDVLEPRVPGCVVPDEDGLAVLERPPRDPFAALERNPADEVLVRL